MSRYSVTIWERTPSLDEFGNKILHSRKYDIARILDAYGYFNQIGAEVHDYTFRRKYTEHTLLIGDIPIDIWETELKPLLIEESFNHEAEILEKYINDDSTVIVFKDNYYTRLDKGVRAYIVKQANINTGLLFKMINMEVVKPVFEIVNYEEIFAVPNSIRFVIKPSRLLLKMFKNYSVGKRSVIVIQTYV